MVLAGGRWNPAAQPASVADTAQALLHDPAAIGFGGLEEGAPGLRTLAIAPAEGSAPVELTAASAASGAYPLTRYMYIRLNRRPGRPLPPQIREFLRYVLSRDAQEPVRYSGYFPLNAEEVRREMAKLD